MLLSKSCNYAIRAVLYISLHSEQDYVPIKNIAKDLNISFHFLTKILQNLTEAGLLRSYRGPRGGVSLAKPAEQISLADIIVAIDGDALFTRCVLGLDNCTEENPCPLHESWIVIRKELKRMFEGQNVAVLSERLRNEDLRLVNMIPT